MLGKLGFLIYLVGIIPSGGLISAALIERQKRIEMHLANRRRTRNGSSRYEYDYDDEGIPTRKLKRQSQPDGLRPEDRTIHPVDRRNSMVIGYALGVFWPWLVAIAAVGAATVGIGWVLVKTVGAISMTVGNHVLAPTTRKFEARIEQRTLGTKPELEARKLGSLERLKT